jgi:tetratricopeptide (TPR) repeat protein
VEWLDRLESELDNLRVALGRAQETGVVMHGLRLARSLYLFWDGHSRDSEGLRWLAAFLAVGPQDGAGHTEGSPEVLTLRAWALVDAGQLASLQTEPAVARELVDRSLVLFRELGNISGIATALHIRGAVAREEGDYVGAAALLEESVTLLRGMGDERELGGSLFNLAITLLQQGHTARAATLAQESLALLRAAGGTWRMIANTVCVQAQVAWQQGDLQRAESLGRESLALFREMGTRRGVALTLGFLLAHVAREQGDLERAIALSEESLDLGRDLGDAGIIGWACLALGLAAGEQGDLARAAAALGEALSLFWARGMRWFLARCLAGLAVLASKQGDLQRVARLNGATDALLSATGAPLPRGERILHDGVVAAARLSMGEHAYAAARVEGQTASLEQILTESSEYPANLDGVL